MQHIMTGKKTVQSALFREHAEMKFWGFMG